MMAGGRRAFHATGGAPSAAPAVMIVAGVAMVAGAFVWLTAPRPETSYEYPSRGVDTSYVWPQVSRTIVVHPEDLDRESEP